MDKLKIAPDAPLASRSDRSDISLADRQTDELVIALVGPVGSGVTKTAQTLRSIFEKKFKYTVQDLHVADIIVDCAGKLGIPINVGTTRDSRIAELQRIGTLLRKQFTEGYIAEKCVEKIAVQRLSGGYRKPPDEAVPEPRRIVHIVDSLKNPAEINLLRSVYGETFWVVGVFAPEAVREQRLKNDGVGEEQLNQIMMTDEEEGVDHGQRVRETIHLADFFIRNDEQNDLRLQATVDRYLELVFNIGIHTPTQHETAMYNAASAAAASACLSRQVGAAIYSTAGELIGVGANDVPKFGGGLYTEADGAGDHRCFLWEKKICHNEDRKDRLYKAIHKELKRDKLLVDHATEEAVAVAVKRTDVKNLVEYSRAVHAEMEAIVSVARSNKPGIIGATMYTTTFPCHSCARHIVASGIEEVIYTEPYPKSLALALHRDAISVHEAPDGKVKFLQFEGVAPQNLIKLFKNGKKRKDHGQVIVLDPAGAHPVFPSPLDGFSWREKIVVNNLEKIEEKARLEKKEGTHEAATRTQAATELPL